MCRLPPEELQGPKKLRTTEPRWHRTDLRPKTKQSCAAGFQGEMQDKSRLRDLLRVEEHWPFKFGETLDQPGVKCINASVTNYNVPMVKYHKIIESKYISRMSGEKFQSDLEILLMFVGVEPLC